MPSCLTCGTSTGIHWPNCPLSSQYDPNYYTSKPLPRQTAISERTPAEKEAYIQGFEACLKQIEKGFDGRDGNQLMRNFDIAKSAFALIKETL